ncbi:MAG: efflux RND transporter periplasmic adaptor subunit, partial [Myxococcales bacterium]|nr:efflux RND transporter periplasmic adaptor subunit [Myxococcales bacterium]
GAAAASASAKPADQPVTATGLTLRARKLTSTVNAVGTLTSNESVALSPEVSRRLVKVVAEDGARVKKGDVLFELDAADLLARQNELSVRRKLLAGQAARATKLQKEGISSEAAAEQATSELELIDAQLETLRVDLSRTKIRAPFDGKLGIRRVSAGAMVTPQTVLVALEDDSRIKVDFTVPERYAALLKEGGRFSFKVEGSPETFEGTVRALEPRLSTDTRSMLARGVADKASPVMITGASVSVEIAVGGTVDDALFVPSEAVIPSVGGHGVYRYEDGVAKLVDVEIGLRGASEVQVKTGLAAGDIVLIDNLLRLRPGAKVTLKGVAPAGSSAPSAEPAR